MRVPGACASLLEALVGCGFRIGELAVFLASRPFGRPELYLPSGPILYQIYSMLERRSSGMYRRARKALFLLSPGEGESAGELLRADADETELAVPGILAVVEEGQE